MSQETEEKGTPDTSEGPVEAPRPDERALLEQTAAGQQAVLGQIALFRQQMLTLFGNLNSQVHEHGVAVHKELSRFQTGGPKQAMASVFHKLFRDLLRHMNQLDDMVASAPTEPIGGDGDQWVESIQTLRHHFEAILADWGCEAMPVREGQDEFDPEIHEAADPGQFPIPEGTPPETVVKVLRRGWKLSGTIIQHPLVVAS